MTSRQATMMRLPLAATTGARSGVLLSVSCSSVQSLPPVEVAAMISVEFIWSIC